MSRPAPLLRTTPHNPRPYVEVKAKDFSMMPTYTSKRSVFSKTPPFASVLISPLRERWSSLTLTPSHSEYQARGHGSRPISTAHPHRHPSKPQGTFIATFLANFGEHLFRALGCIEYKDTITPGARTEFSNMCYNTTAGRCTSSRR
jgi:hypothetical protein